MYPGDTRVGGNIIKGGGALHVVGKVWRGKREKGKRPDHKRRGGLLKGRNNVMLHAGLGWGHAAVAWSEREGEGSHLRKYAAGGGPMIKGGRKGGLERGSLWGTDRSDRGGMRWTTGPEKIDQETERRAKKKRTSSCLVSPGGKGKFRVGCATREIGSERHAH